MRSDLPKVLLKDVGLPGRSGIDLAITLLQENITTYVILASGQTTTADDIQHALPHGYALDGSPSLSDQLN